MISIIIPTVNRAKMLEFTLNSLANQHFDSSQFEILIVDNASTDNTKEISNKFIQNHTELTTRYIFEPLPGLLSGRHRGAFEAKNELLVFIDDDIIAHPDWLKSIVDSFKDETVHLVGGKCLPKFETEPPFWVDYLWLNVDEVKLCSYYSLINQGVESKETDPNYVWGLNFAMRKKTLFDLGGFHPDCVPKNVQRFQGDGETGLTQKLKQKKLRAMYHPKAIVYHWITKERMTFEYIERRMYYQGVCDSFTKIRENYYNSNKKNRDQIVENNTNGKKQTLFLGVKSRLSGRDIKNEINTLRNEINTLRNQVSELSPTKLELFERMRIAYARGFEFHQNEAKNDPKLFGWIIKNDYFDFDYFKYF